MDAQKQFPVVLIKPSHYDDDGYVIQWFRSAVPSNSLAVVNGLAVDCAQRRVLGEDIEIVVSSLDEDNTRVRPERIARQFVGRRGLVMLVGVQSNQFPRAMDIARPLRKTGIPVCIGGFHVSGCLSMLGGITPELKEAQDLGISLFAGEAEENRMDQVFRDAWNGELKPLYNYLNDLPSLEGAPVPMLPATTIRRTIGKLHQLRCWTRLPVPVLVLHHHQRAGAQIATPHCGRDRADCPPQSRSGRGQLLHH